MEDIKVVKSTGTIMIITMVSKILGFFRDALIAKGFGTNYKTDAYNMAGAIPNILFGVLGLAITTTFIPMLSECYKNKNKEHMFNFANNITNIMLEILSISS